MDFLLFLSTPSARRATGEILFDDGFHVISIHALREVGDKSQCCTLWQIGIFLSTPSARRATDSENNRTVGRVISIHALREEGDSKNRDKISIFL